MRSRILGHHLRSVTSARVLHDEQTKELSYRPGTEFSPTRVYCFIRNRWQVFSDNYSLRTLLGFVPALFVYELVQFWGTVRRELLGFC